MRTASKSCPTCRQPFLPPLEGTSRIPDPPPELRDHPTATSRESDGFTIPPTAQDMEDFIRRAAEPPNLEDNLSQANVLADFQRFILGHSAGPRGVAESREREDDRQDYYGMYS